MTIENEKLTKEISDAVAAQRKATEEINTKADSLGQGVSEAKEMAQKSKEALEKFDGEAQSKFLAMKAIEKVNLDLKERLEGLEVLTAKLSVAGPGEVGQKRAEYVKELKALNTFSRINTDYMTDDNKAEVKSYLRSDNNVQGGFLMAESFDDMILKPITETSIIRPLCRTKRIDALSERFVHRASLVTASWEGEGEAADNTNSTYSQSEIHVHKLDVSTKITYEALQGSRFNIESGIMADFAEARGYKEGAAFVTGTSVGQPMGFMNDIGKVPSVNASGSSTFDFDDLIALTGKLKTGYNPMYFFNRTTLAFLRALKDDVGNYIWRDGNMGVGVPNQINGNPFVVLPDMADIATDAYPVLFGDLREMFTVVDAFQAVLQRNPYLTGNDRSKVEFGMMSWVGSGVVKPESGRRLKTIA